MFVEPLGRAVLSGVPAPRDDDDDEGEGEPADALPRRRPLDVCILPLFSDERPLTGLAGFFDWRASGMLSGLVRRRWCTGRAGEAVLMPARKTLPATRIVLFGLGRSTDFDDATARRAAAAMVGVARDLRPQDVMLAMPGKGQERAIVEAVFDAALSTLSTLNTSGGEPRAGGVGETAQWWVIADPRHVARLRRVLDGPPRAAGGAE